VQGSAGSGKTTIGLHRIAYLAFAEPRRFRPDKMLVIVYQRALAAYVSRVLPSLDVEGVPVMTFAGWAAAVRRAALPKLEAGITDETPSVVMRVKAHGSLLRLIDAVGTFDQIFVLTKGGPGTSTQLISTYSYNTAFQFTDYGRAMAMVVALLVLVVLLSIVAIRLMRRAAAGVRA